MRPVEEASFAEQRAEDAGSTVCRADLPHDEVRKRIRMGFLLISCLLA
jgi:hypothetical protein